MSVFTMDCKQKKIELSVLIVLLDDMIISSGERNVGCSLMSMLRVILVWSSGFTIDVLVI